MSNLESHELNAALESAVMETLGEMLFAEPDIESDDASAAELSLWSYVDSQAPFSGRITLRLSKDVAGAFTETLYGMEQSDLSIQQVLDVVAELVNTVAGCFLAQVDPDAPVKLGLPATGEGAMEGEVGEITLFRVDEGVFGVSLRPD